MASETFAKSIIYLSEAGGVNSVFLTGWRHRMRTVLHFPLQWAVAGGDRAALTSFSLGSASTSFE